jgi:putative cardiolipin synthase
VGYANHLKTLLGAGVTVWELSPSLSVKRRKVGVFGNRTGALHMKAAIVDHSQVYLGSMNLDQRSAKLNTALGPIIESPELAAQLEHLADPRSSYRLRLSPDGEHIQWIEYSDTDTETVYDVPPETSAWLRFKVLLLSPFIPEREL